MSKVYIDKYNDGIFNNGSHVNECIVNNYNILFIYTLYIIYVGYIVLYRIEAETEDTNDGNVGKTPTFAAERRAHFTWNMLSQSVIFVLVKMGKFFLFPNKILERVSFIIHIFLPSQGKSNIRNQAILTNLIRVKFTYYKNKILLILFFLSIHNIWIQDFN